MSGESELVMLEGSTSLSADTAGKVSVISDGSIAPHKRIDDIEILRAIAVTFVLIQHLPLALPSLGLFGAASPFYRHFGFWDGVDLFFAVSGFVIARSLLPSLAAAPNRLVFLNTALAFWVRRAWRLLPSAWLWLLLLMTASALFNHSGVFGSFRSNLEGGIAALLEAANIRTAWGASSGFEVGPTFPYWSLSLEEQFYLLLPFLALWSGQRLPAVLGLMVLLQIFVPRGLGTGMFSQLGWFRSDAILLGVLIAVWSAKPTHRLFDPTFLEDRPRLGGCLTLGFMLVLAAVGSPNQHIVFFQMGLVAMISALWVLIASYDKNCFCPDGPLKSALLWLGSRSYGLYLIHVPAFYFTRELWFRLEPQRTTPSGQFEFPFACTVGFLLVMLTELNYRLLELPLRRHGARISERITSRLMPTEQVG